MKDTKKDIKWLKEQFEELGKTPMGGEYAKGATETYVKIAKLLEQVYDTQEQNVEVAKLLGQVYDMQEQKAEPNKPVPVTLPIIPQFVADAIVEYKARDHSLGELLGGIEWGKHFIRSEKVDEEKVFDWVFVEYQGTQSDVRQELIAEAWIKNEWTILDEKNIIVTFKNKDKYDTLYTAELTLEEADKLRGQIEDWESY